MRACSVSEGEEDIGDNSINGQGAGDDPHEMSRSSFVPSDSMERTDSMIPLDTGSPAARNAGASSDVVGRVDEHGELDEIQQDASPPAVRSSSSSGNSSSCRSPLIVGRLPSHGMAPAPIGEPAIEPVEAKSEPSLMEMLPGIKEAYTTMTTAGESLIAICREDTKQRPGPASRNDGKLNTRNQNLIRDLGILKKVHFSDCLFVCLFACLLSCLLFSRSVLR